MWQRFYEERVALLENLLAIPVPVISAVNGPAFIHAEVAVLSDIVLAAKHAEFGAARRSNATPNSGVQAVWLMLLGPNRGRYFLLSNERINADEAKRLGLVGEVLPADQLMARARILAGQLAQLSVRQLRHTRRIMVRHIRRRLRDELEFSVAAEALVRMD
jgi:enoyl-CoA hydratase/carnithine racemase